MKSNAPFCENGGKMVSCTPLPTTGSRWWEEEGKRAEGGVASLAIAFQGRSGHLLIGISRDVGEKLKGAKSMV